MLGDRSGEQLDSWTKRRKVNVDGHNTDGQGKGQKDGRINEKLDDWTEREKGRWMDGQTDRRMTSVDKHTTGKL